MKNNWIATRRVMLGLIICLETQSAHAGFLDQLTPEKMRKVQEAVPYAELSTEIYEHDTEYDSKNGANISVSTSSGVWKRFESDRASITKTYDGPGAATTKVVIQDPISFHAEAYKNRDGKIAIVFEGTGNLKDWMANLGQPLLLSAVPKQYKKALDFANKVIKECVNTPGCNQDEIVVTGHSLGGGLAQYVATNVVDANVKAYAFNSAGLWGGTTETMDTGKGGNITNLVSRGYAKIAGIKMDSSTDFVSKTGVLFGEIIEIPADIGMAAMIPVVRMLAKHDMENLKNWMVVAYTKAHVEVGEQFLKLRAELKAETDNTKKKQLLAQIDQLLQGEGAFLFANSNDPNQERKNYIETLAKSSGITLGLESHDLGGAGRGSRGDLATALVIDRSGSMIGHTVGSGGVAVLSANKSDLQKLEKAKEAAKSYILSRGGSDLVSVSTFSDSGNTEQDLTAVSSIEGQIDKLLGKIGAAGGTNIGAGLEQGFAQLDKAPSEVNKMAILLSDGENNRGDWRPTVKKFKEKGWPICTIGFGSDADEQILQSIATDTGCSCGYIYADTVDVVSKYQDLGNCVESKSTLLSVNDALSPQGKTTYPFYVSALATMLDISTSWQGSKLGIKLTAPDGKVLDKGMAAQGNGRYEEGDTFQMLEIEAPTPGKWTIETSWVEPPTETERVNLLIAEKSDVFGRIHGFRPQYSIGESVTIKIDADEVVGVMKAPLASASVAVKVQKPGPQMIRMVQAQSTNWTMYKDVVLDVTREIALFDDGNHGDYKAGDGIFGGSYTETDKNGAYLVTAIIKGKKQNGQSIEKTLISSFQVGPITQNQVTTSQTLQYREKANVHIDNTTPYSDKILQQPVEKIERLQGDPLDNIDKLLN